MALSDAQLDWAKKLAGQKDAVEAAVAAQDDKVRMLGDAWRELDGKVEEIRIGQDFVMSMKKTGLSGFMRRVFHADAATKQGIGKGQDPDKQFDTGHDMAESEGLDAKQAAALMRAQSLVVEQVSKLREARDPASRKPLFTDVEIAKEVWEPLMRRKIIPENAISNQYSDVARTFEGASEQYDLRLAAYTESLDDWDGLAAKFGLSGDLIKKAGTTANNVMGMLVAANPAMKDFPLTEVTTIVTAVTLAAATPLDIASLVVKDGGLTPKNMEKIAKSIVSLATATVSAEFIAQYPGDSDSDKIGRELGKAINSGLTVGLSSVTFAAKMAQGGDKAREALDEIGTIVEQCCGCVGSVASVRENKKNDGEMALVGRHVKDIFVGGKELTMILSAAAADDPAAVITKSLQNLVKQAIDEGAKTYATIRQADRKEEAADKRDADDAKDGSEQGKKDHKQEYDDTMKFDANFNVPTDVANIAGGTAAVGTEALGLDAMMKLAQTTSRADLVKLFKDDPALKANAKAQKLMLAIADKRDADLAAINANLDQELADDDAAFRALLSGSEGDADIDAEVESIEVLILQIKKDQAMLKMAEALIKAGPTVVAAFFPPAAIAVDAAQVLISMRKAVSHMVAWRDWNANLEDARSAMSVQAAAMANRAGISRGKAIDESINALMSGISLVGNVLSTVGGPVAHAGVAVSKGVQVLQVTKEVILKVYDEAKLKQNWARYQKALKNPDDRVAIRTAMRGNPTLAKYVIAYGAVVGQDPVAKNALKKCGLSAKVLQSPKSNEQKVVEFLETLYADDPVVLEKLDSPPNWYPGPVALTGESVAAFSFAGQKVAKPPLSAPIPGAAKALMAAETQRSRLDLARTAWETAEKADPPDDQATEDARKAFVAELTHMELATNRVLGHLAGWKPEAEGGKPHKDGAAYRSSLVRMATAVHKKAERELAMYA